MAGPDRPIAVCWNAAPSGGQNNEFELPREQRFQRFLFLPQQKYNLLKIYFFCPPSDVICKGSITIISKGSDNGQDGNIGCLPFAWKFRKFMWICKWKALGQFISSYFKWNAFFTGNSGHREYCLPFFHPSLLGNLYRNFPVNGKQQDMQTGR